MKDPERESEELLTPFFLRSADSESGPVEVLQETEPPPSSLLESSSMTQEPEAEREDDQSDAEPVQKLAVAGNVEIVMRGSSSIPAQTALTSFNGYAVSLILIFLGLSLSPQIWSDLVTPARLWHPQIIPPVQLLFSLLAFLICLRFEFIALRYSSYLPAKILFSLVFASIVLPVCFCAGLLYSSCLDFHAWAEAFSRLAGGTLKSDEFISMTFGLSMFVLFIGVVPVLIFQSIFPKFYLKSSYSGLLLGTFGWSDLLGEKELDYKDIDRASTLKDSNGKISLELKLKGRQTVRLDWKDLCDHMDPIVFLNALREHGVLGNMRCLQQRSDEGNESYTQLWLKYFSSSKRMRTGELSEGESLHDGRYIVMGELGQGGQGTAYLCSSTESMHKGNAESFADRADLRAEAPFDGGSELASDGRELVVLKEYVLPVHRGDEIFQQSLRKLQREAEILATLNHPKIVALKDSFVEDHRGYLVLEFVEGRTLKDLVAKTGPQPESFVLELALQICEILEYLHGMNPPVIHRDLTPDNLILQESGQVKLVDFNVAQQLDSSLTSTVVGKHAYIPPEQFRGKPGVRSDIFALGCSLHYLLTANEPEPLSVSHPKNFSEDLSAEIDAIVAKATALDEKERFENIAQMRDELLALKAKRAERPN